jgi:KaiC/GvpD/RAD55 family RecA-like ATPase
MNNSFNRLNDKRLINLEKKVISKAKKKGYEELFYVWESYNKVRHLYDANDRFRVLNLMVKMYIN